MDETVYRCVCGNTFDNWQGRDACAESGHGVMEREPACPACTLKDARIEELEALLRKRLHPNRISYTDRPSELCSCRGCMEIRAALGKE